MKIDTIKEIVNEWVSVNEVNVDQSDVDLLVDEIKNNLKTLIELHA